MIPHPFTRRVERGKVSLWFPQELEIELPGFMIQVVFTPQCE